MAYVMLGITRRGTYVPFPLTPAKKLRSDHAQELWSPGVEELRRVGFWRALHNILKPTHTTYHVGFK